MIVKRDLNKFYYKLQILNKNLINYKNLISLKNRNLINNINKNLTNHKNKNLTNH